MALWRVGEPITDIFNYNLWDGVEHLIHYNDFLVTPPRIYQEGTDANSIKAFFYVPPQEDVLCLRITGARYHWPGWFAWRLTFNAQTGAWIETVDQSSVGGLWPYYSNVEVGSNKFIFTSSFYKILELNWETGLVTGWEIDTATWSEKRSFSTVSVNKDDKLVVGTAGNTFEVWNYETGIRLWRLPLPGSIKDLAWESNDIVWALMADGKLVKINYKLYRVELFSSIQSVDPEDLSYAIAYDCLRNRLAVVRNRADATDGHGQWIMEFYYPSTKPSILLEPVPIEPIQVGAMTRFVTNTIGDVGEPVGGQLIEAALVAPNNHGTVRSPAFLSGVAGAGVCAYQAPATEELETLEFSTQVQDNLGE